MFGARGRVSARGKRERNLVLQRGALSYSTVCEHQFEKAMKMQSPLDEHRRSCQYAAGRRGSARRRAAALAVAGMLCT